ncbi:alpha/beta hydrolase [Bradyrhizobium sp.]|uniref:alpha/beta hydrolase n=1 Tax=Bradyrhizobium sp. TaxID=376 RepID=UPI003C59F257
MTSDAVAQKLDPREEHFHIPGPRPGLSLFLRFLPAMKGEFKPRRAVLYLHGATFASALSVAYRFGDEHPDERSSDTQSWRDALNDAGFDVWGLDFYGFGHSDRYPEMSQPAADNPPLCVAEDAAQQLNAAVQFILGRQRLEQLSLISHSWGSMPACLFAAAHPARIDRLVLFAPIGRRGPRRYETPAALPAWRIVTPRDQWTRFTEDVPEHEKPVLSRAHFAEWSQRYLDSDPESRCRDPAGVKTPLGPFSEIIKAWHGQLAYDPARVRAPVAIIRGEWDGLMLDDDARRLFDGFGQSPVKRDIKIGRGTHLMHLEMMRAALWRESISFLRGDDVASVP